jgi:nucleoid DNA-binding protein
MLKERPVKERLDVDADGRETIAKRAIAERIAERRGLRQVETLRVIQDFLNEISNELAKGNRLEFRDFGVFETVIRQARTALNPRTLERVPVRSRIVVKFKVGRRLKAKVEALRKDREGGASPEAAGAPPAVEHDDGDGDDRDADAG